MKQKETITELIKRLANEGYTYERMYTDGKENAQFLFLKGQESKLFADEHTITVSLYAVSNVRNLIRQYFGN